MPPFLLATEPVETIDAYLATEYGGKGVERAEDIGPQATIDEVLASGLRGRGGGGFPTGRKWQGIASETGPKYLVVNGAEGEPGTFKDRALLRANPYQLVEALIIAAFAAIGSGIGSAGFIVHDDTACMVNAAYVYSRFLSVESCGRCPPCKLGSGEITEHLQRLETGGGGDDDIDGIGHWITHLGGGRVTYDESFWRKRPDWTYEPG